MYVCMHACMHACMHVCMCMYIYIYVYISINTYIFFHIHESINKYVYICTYSISCIIVTSNTAQGGGGSFNHRKPKGEIGCCESRMAERIH